MNITAKSDRDGRTLLVATVAGPGIEVQRFERLVEDIETLVARHLLDDDEAAKIVAG